MAGSDIIISANAQQAISEINKVLGKVEQLQTTFKDKFGQMGASVLGLAAAFTAAAGAVAAYADDITDIAAANEVAISQVLGLSKALEANGGKAENVGKMFQTMSNNIEEANGGNLKTLATFQRLGVSLEDLGTKSNTALKDQLLAGLAGIKDPLERSALAAQVFGKSLIGVNIKEFAKDQKRMADEMAPYASSIETAGNAWDNMVSILGKIKIAFASAFEPIFWLISKLPVNIELVSIAFRAMAVGAALAAAPAIIAGFYALAKAIQTVTLVAARNPFTLLLVGLAALGPTLLSYLGLMDDVDSIAQKNNDTTLEGKRNQEGVNDALQKQKDTLSQIRENLDKSFKATLAKYDVELQVLSLNEDQKKVAEELAKIEADKIAKLSELEQKYQAMDKDSRARNKSTYEQEQALIEQTAESAKRATETKLKGIQDYANVLKKFQGINQQGAEAEQKIFEAMAKQKIDSSGYQERIELEAKLGEIQRIRSELTGNLSKLSEEDRAKAIAAISESTDNVNLLNMSYQEVGNSIDENIRKSNLSAESVQKLLSTTDKGFGMIATGAEALGGTNQKIAGQSRTFSSGWTKAFNEYADNAANAAQQAQKVFQSMTQGMEDMLMNFFKTGKFEWNNFVQMMIETLLRSQLQQTLASVMSIGSAGAGSALGGLGSLLGFANGGIIPTNGPVIVGERGPEILSGVGGRTVTPNSQLGGNTTVNYNISAVDAMSFKQMIARDPSFIHAVAMQGGRSIPGRA